MIESVNEISNFLSKNPGIIDKVHNIQKGGDVHFKSDLSNELSQYVIDIMRFKRISILNKEGVIISSSDRDRLNFDYSTKEIFQTGKNTENFIFGFFYDENEEFSLMISDQIKNRIGEVIGIVVIELDAADFLTITNDYTGLGRTGETNLGMIKNGKAMYITPLKFDRNAAFKSSNGMDDKRSVMNVALSRKEGIQENVIDYMGQDVIAHTKFINETGWGMVTKMDKEEALSSMKTLRNILIVVTVGFIAFAFIVSFLLGKYLAKSIEELIDHTKRLKEGSLNTRINKKFNNELGELAASFNEMADRLERKMNDLDKFAYVISHDLKAPLNSITPLLSYVKEDSKDRLDEESVKMLDMASDKAIQMGEMINEILASTKGDRKAQEIVNINKIIEYVIDNINPPSNIQIFVQNNLPVLKFHKISIIQVFQNIIGNAVKYMDKPKGEIKIEYLKQEKSHMFCIKDNGPGISKENKGKIFELFQIAHSNDLIDSSGIGLSIVKNIIEDNKGQIWVESDPGNGSCFCFTIPVMPTF
jgi:signal transduction histidine kinase